MSTKPQHTPPTGAPGARLDHTHDLAARSWVASANGHAVFPLQNLPLGRWATTDGNLHVGTAIGDQVLDLAALAASPKLDDATRQALQPVAGGDLSVLMAAGPAASRALRHVVFGLLSEAAPAGGRAAVEAALSPLDGVRMVLPCRSFNFSDFYSSIHHATRIGAMVRPDNPLLPNYRWLPVAYQGRTSSLLPAGTPFHRPRGQVPGADKLPVYAPSAKLDYEAELGFLTGRSNPLGEPVPLAQARDHLFGVSLLNDWSARDIQFWEYAPLGPFLGKSFATHLGGWVVTREALEPFWTAPPWADDPEHRLLPHLDSRAEREGGALDLTVEVHIRSERMRQAGLAPMRLSRSSYRDSYWTVAQLIAHQTSNGANLEPGDLLGSGTLSGPTDDARACLMELTTGGREPFVLPSGESRTFLADGDEVVMSGYCERPGFARIGLGVLVASVLPAR
ncbi:fumarylacetoacetase [Pseudorhodoferax sp.]|uniref:fumarylacetoacetase n=1 Tax=Pseudorhodoferax sp. TaxID=1993553 RepID=UPI002DD663E2|nr:fumarylacetoacetase [Pseudorhodoferax sp.]